MKKKETTPKLDRSLISFRSLGREQRRLFGLYALGLCLVFLLAALIAFFAILKGPEKVMVPDLRGMELADALVRMQERELYPRLSLRFTNNPQDKNTILEQDPLPGVIVKAGRRIKLTVSRGAVLDEIDNYIGKNIDAVKLELLSLFSSTQALVSIREPPVYRFDDAEPGTILEQSPPAGEQISGPTVLELVVSKGPESAKKKSTGLPGFEHGRGDSPDGEIIFHGGFFDASAQAGRKTRYRCGTATKGWRHRPGQG